MYGGVKYSSSKVLYNWSEQLKLHAPCLSVRTYYGSDRDRGAKSFCHDVTLTTYEARMVFPGSEA